MRCLSVILGEFFQKRFLTIILIIGSFQLFAQDDPIVQLRQDLDVLFADPSLTNAYCGVAVKSLKVSDMLYQRNEHKALIPASNQKLFVTTAALMNLGADFRIRTDLYTAGIVDAQKKTLHGDLILFGRGDPTMASRFFLKENAAPFKSIADSLRSKGIHQINGRIIGDDSYFDDERWGEGWAWDSQIEVYSAQISALSYNENSAAIVFTPGDSAGSPAAFRLEPLVDYINIDNQVKTADYRRSRIYLRQLSGKNTIVCRGTVYRRAKTRTEWFSINDPARFAAGVLRQTLISAGIPVTHGYYSIGELDTLTKPLNSKSLIATMASPTILEIITVINKDSQNLHAEMLLRLLGKEIEGMGNAYGGLLVLKESLIKAGIDPHFSVWVDGSGLSRKNLITPMNVIQLLSYNQQQNYADQFKNSLSVAGVDGSLKGRMKKTRAQENVRAKTGTLDGVKTLSGYITARNGEELAFSLLINNFTAPNDVASRIQDQFCEILANWSRQ